MSRTSRDACVAIIAPKPLLDLPKSVCVTKSRTLIALLPPTALKLAVTCAELAPKLKSPTTILPSFCFAYQTC